ncbi:MAG: hypothetical protein U0176_23365 [Bacteroidia bacterium]
MAETTNSHSIWERRWAPFAVMAAFALLYFLNRSPFVGFNDGLSFLLSASTGWDLATNATSHFLYNNLQHLLLTVLPFLPHVLVLTSFSILCALGTLWLVYKSGRLFTQSQAAALLPVIVLGVSFTFWQQSEIIEVYAFNGLIFMGYLHLALRDIVAGTRRYAMVVSALLGLGLLTHIQHILSIPFFLVWIWGRNPLSIAKRLLAMVPWMALGSLLFILPAVTGLNTWQSVFFESKFQDELLGMDIRALLKGVALGLGMLAYNFLLLWIPIGRGWRRLWREKRKTFLWLALLGLPYLGFAMKYAVNDNHVFYLCFHFVLLLPLAIWADARDRKSFKWLFPAAFVLPILVYAATTWMAPLVPALRHYDEAKAYKGGVTHLLWPGKAWAKDPLELAKALFAVNPYPNEDEAPEWNFKVAVDYLFDQKEIVLAPKESIELEDYDFEGMKPPPPPANPDLAD